MCCNLLLSLEQQERTDSEEEEKGGVALRLCHTQTLFSVFAFVDLAQQNRGTSYFKFFFVNFWTRFSHWTSNIEHKRSAQYVLFTSIVCWSSDYSSDLNQMIGVVLMMFAEAVQLLPTVLLPAQYIKYINKYTAIILYIYKFKCACIQGQPWLCAHCNTSKWPPRAAKALVHISQGQPWLRAHCNTSK